MEEERWIECENMQPSSSTLINDDDDDDETTNDMHHLFADPDPYDTFNKSFSSSSSTKNISITLRGIKAENGQTLDSTGLTLWMASDMMCDYLMATTTTTTTTTETGDDDVVTNRTVLELGAGLGLCGILCHHLGASKVILTDGDTDTLSHMRDNCQRNIPTTDDDDDYDSKISCRQLLWGRNVSSFRDAYGTFSTIIASDVIYVEEIVEPLLDTVVELLDKECDEEGGGAVFLLGFVRRNVPMALVWEGAMKRGLKGTPPKDGREDGVFVFRWEGGGDCGDVTK